MLRGRHLVEQSDDIALNVRQPASSGVSRGMDAQGSGANGNEFLPGSGGADMSFYATVCQSSPEAAYPSPVLDALNILRRLAYQLGFEPLLVTSSRRRARVIPT